MNLKIKISWTNIIVLILGISTSNLFAQDIYTWTDAEGRTHYSNEAKDKSAKSATLPNTERYDSDQRIKDLKKEAERTCLNRGGVQCSLGEDQDGSVLCSDGSKDSEETFKASCSEVKLIAEIKKPKKRLSKQLLQIPLNAVVRNESSQDAKEVSVRVKLPETPNSDKFYELKLEGPTSIPSYGAGQYTYSGKLIDDRVILKGVITADCENCLKIPENKQLDIQENQPSMGFNP